MCVQFVLYIGGNALKGQLRAVQGDSGVHLCMSDCASLAILSYCTGVGCALVV